MTDHRRHHVVLGLDKTDFERTSILRHLDVIEHNVDIVLTESPRFYEVLHMKHIETHLLGLL